MRPAPRGRVARDRMQASTNQAEHPDFETVLARQRLGPLRRWATRTLQVNVGKLCNQACHHCHVDAGPRRTEMMTRATAERVVELLASSPGVTTIDLTGGAPELNPHFRFLAERGCALGRRVMVRCNLTVLFVPGMEWLPEFYREIRAELVCSLPCYTAENVTLQRGQGVFEKSIEALRLLNRLGYGASDELPLDLVYNPVGAFLPPAQAELDSRYRGELRSKFGVEFRQLLTITNMPIARFAHQLARTGQYAAYMGLLVNHFNPATVAGLMCRALVSVGWTGTLYDCDFNQMLEIPLERSGSGRPLTIYDLEDAGALAGSRIATGSHCFGCTAGAGSGCAGALV